MAAIRKELKPQSFATGKTMTLKNVTEHHPEGVGFNVIGVIPGTDPKLKDEVIIIGGHLDHLGRLWELMPGANDNATAVAVGLGVAEAMAKCAIKPKRTVVFIFFGSEEQGVAGLQITTANTPSSRWTRPLVFINMEGPGSRGQDLGFGRDDLSRPSGRSSRRPTRTTSTGSVSAPARPPIPAGRARTRPGSSGRACRR